MDHAFYIDTAYGLSGLIVLCLIIWVVGVGRLRQKETLELEKSGMTRRSRAKPSHEGQKAGGNA